MEDKKIRKFKYVGTKEDADGYKINIPEVGRVYREDQRVGLSKVAEFADASMLSMFSVSEEWQEVFEEETKKIRRFKYVGDQELAEGYRINIPKIGHIYEESDPMGRSKVASFVSHSVKEIANEWEEVFVEEKPTIYQKDLFTGDKKQLFTSQVEKVLRSIRDLLLSKNQKYGNSALDPVRIFSKSSSSEQILVRIDDKLSRIKTMGIDSQIDEDTINDLIGYLVLLKVSRMN